MLKIDRKDTIFTANYHAF